MNSMSDLFHQDVPVDYIAKVFDAMRRAPQHRFQVLTKRPGRMASVLQDIQPIPLSHVWLGTSVESEAYTWRIDKLRATPATVRFLSLEPLLRPIPNLDLSGVGWVIVGGESGHGARPMDIDWARDIRDQCAAAAVPFFFKQTGAVAARNLGGSGKGTDVGAIPSDLAVRQYPGDLVPA